jgi:succinyl-diaminopimelate desuccinylase
MPSFVFAQDDNAMIVTEMKEEIISHLRQFVNFRTIEGAKEEKKKCLDWIDETFLCRRESRLFAAARTRESVLRGEIENAPYLFLPHPNPKLLFFAHIDVVPAEEHQFVLRQDADKLIGRGTSDMKGNQLPFLMAFRDAIERGEDPSVSILFTSDEETAGSTIPTLLAENTLGEIPVAFTPDTKNRIVVEHKGACWADLVCRGKGTHGAYPWKGENPIVTMAEAIKKIHESFPDGAESDWQMTVSFSKLTGSVARNQIPEIATCGLDVRFPPEVCKTPKEALTRIINVLPKHCTIGMLLSADPLKTDPHHKMVQRVKKIAEEVTGDDVQFSREHGGTDARYFGAKGIPAFLYGPVGNGIHGVNEWVSLESLMQQYEIAEKLLRGITT